MVNKTDELLVIRRTSGKTELPGSGMSVMGSANGFSGVTSAQVQTLHSISAALMSTNRHVMPSLAGHSRLYPIIHGRILTIPTFKGQPQEEEPEHSLRKSGHKGGKKSLDVVTELREEMAKGT